MPFSPASPSCRRGCWRARAARWWARSAMTASSYLSLLVNPRFPGAQYAFLTGFAFLPPRLLAGAGGTMVGAIGYDGFFLSLAAGEPALPGRAICLSHRLRLP